MDPEDLVNASNSVYWFSMGIYFKDTTSWDTCARFLNKHLECRFVVRPFIPDYFHYSINKENLATLIRSLEVVRDACLKLSERDLERMLEKFPPEVINASFEMSSRMYRSRSDAIVRVAGLIIRSLEFRKEMVYYATEVISILRDFWDNYEMHQIENGMSNKLYVSKASGLSMDQF